MRGHVVICCEDRPRSRPYVDALLAVGAPAECLRVVTPEDLATGGVRELVRAAAGLVLCGGPDLDPRYYGEEPRADANLRVEASVDRLDWEALSGAREGRTPIWAICRGMQNLNVFLGGTLWQDIYSQLSPVLNHSVDRPRDALVHTVKVEPNGHPLAEIFGREPAGVNSRHHQAIRVLAEELVAIARAVDDLVEVVATRSTDWWVRGVQWHPENLVDIPLQRRLWREFVNEARRRAGDAVGAREESP